MAKHDAGLEAISTDCLIRDSLIIWKKCIFFSHDRLWVGQQTVCCSGLCQPISLLAPPGALEHQVSELWRSSQPARWTCSGRGLSQGE